LGIFPKKDGILADMLVAEATPTKAKPLSQLVEEVTQKLMVPYNKRLDLHLNDAHKAAVIESFAKPTNRHAGTPLRK